MLVQMPNWVQSVLAFRPTTISTTGLTVTNPSYGYDTTAAAVDTSSHSVSATGSASTAGTQTYSGAPAHSAIAGTLNVRIKVIIANGNGTVVGPNGTASVYYSTDGSTPSLSFDQTCSWNTGNGTFDVLLTKSLTVDPSTIKILVSETGAKGGSVINSTDYLTTVEADLYDIVFISS